MTTNPEFVDLFQQLDGMVNAFDAEGSGPLRKGEQPFSWAVVETLASPLAEAVPDLRVGIWLLRAGLAREGLPGLTRGLSRLAAWMELPAEELHPLPESGEHPRELHGLLWRWLGTPLFLVAVREAAVWSETSLSLHGMLESTDLAADLAACPVAKIVTTLAEAAACVRRIDQVLMVEAAPMEASLASLGEILSRALLCLNAFLAPKEEAVSIDTKAPEKPSPAIADPAATPPGLKPAVQSREDVQAALEQIIHYFRIQEPGHPAPIFLQRIQRMLGASFEDLLQELFPDANLLVAKLERPASN